MDSRPQVTNLEPRPAIAIRAQVPVGELPRFFAGAFGELGARGGAQIAGPPFAIFHAFEPDKIDVEAAMPLRAPVEAGGRIHPLELAGGPAVQVRHTGAYDDMGPAYDSIKRWLAEHHRKPTAAVREVYLTGPSVPPAERVTLVVQPVEPGEASDAQPS